MDEEEEEGERENPQATMSVKVHIGLSSWNQDGIGDSGLGTLLLLTEELSMECEMFAQSFTTGPS